MNQFNNFLIDKDMTSVISSLKLDEYQVDTIGEVYISDIIILVSVYTSIMVFKTKIIISMINWLTLSWKTKEIKVFFAYFSVNNK